MKRIFTLLLMVAIGFTNLTAQTTTVPPNLDGTDLLPFTYLSDFITADTTADGTQNNDIYLLEKGSLYFFTSEAKWDFDVTLRATGDDALGRPLVARANKSGGSSLAVMYRGFGNFTWDGLYIILGEEGATAAQYESSPFRPEGDDKRFIFNDCIIEKSRQGTIRIEGENTKTYVTNCWIRNFGDYEKFQGNGRIVDTRDNFADSVVISGNVIHNILDRVFIGFRQKGLNYFEYTNNTLFNHIGRHGLIQLNQTKESVIMDNLIMNPSIMGTAPSLASEQISHRNVQNYLFTIDSIVPDASITMSNNNIFWTDDVLSHYESFDSVTQPLILAPEFEAMLTAPSEAFFSEELALGSVPERTRLIQYAEEAMKYKDSVGITDIMVEDISFAGTEFDKGYLFDFSTFDPCYPEDAASATASSTGGPVGSTFLCNYTVSTSDAFDPLLEFSSAPNPATETTTFSFTLTNSGDVNLSIYDYQGKLVKTLSNGYKSAGKHKIAWSDMDMFPKGMYFAQIKSEQGKMFHKVVVQ